MSLQKIDSIELSKYILSEVGKMNHLKLQKMLYYVQSWHLAYFGQELVDDKFEAWLHGPVSRKIWNQYKTTANVYDYINHPEDHETIKQNIVFSLSEDQIDLIKSVFEEYGKLSAFELESLTHSEAPWQKARTGYDVGEGCEKEIDNLDMLIYYKTRLYGSNSQTQTA
jgi:uncharacterized phage-associated protein